MPILPLIFVIFAFVCFALATAGVPDHPYIRLVPAGLAFYMASLFVNML